jgi:hypothetical protein
MKTAAFLPAKGPSQRIANKKTMLLDGETASFFLERAAVPRPAQLLKSFVFNRHE